MRTFLLALSASLCAAGMACGVTYHVTHDHMQQEINRVRVDSFNDGFFYGACGGSVPGSDANCR